MSRPGPHDLVELVLLCSRNELQITPPGVEATETYMYYDVGATVAARSDSGALERLPY